jgi:mono/diheme cytochrome c family protein
MHRSLFTGLALALVSCGTHPSDEGLPTDVRSPWVPPTVLVGADLGPEPPPIAGGTLLMTRDGARAVVSDPDLDRIVVVDLAARAVVGTLPLQRGDEPGRAIEDGEGRVHVVLRGGGSVVTVDATAATLSARRAVCATPRGIAWSAENDTLYVACMGGELITMAPLGEATHSSTIERDLRDVVVQGNRLFVTRFRSAEVLVLDLGGALISRLGATSPAATVGVAWRATPAVGGGAWLLHTRAVAVAPTSQGGYNQGGSGCGVNAGIARPGVTLLRPPQDPVTLGDVPNAPLAVDLAAAPDGQRIALALPGNLATARRPGVVELRSLAASSCAVTTTIPLPTHAQAIAVAYTRDSVLVTQTRAPSTLVLDEGTTVINLGGTLVRNRGHQLFHTNPTGLVACASCHPEGDDDGRTWTFQPIGARRTQSIRGGIAATAPFHWDGDLPHFTHLVSEVLVRRMGATRPTATDGNALLDWIDHLPARPRPAAAPHDRVARGAALFRDPTVGCVGCHSGSMWTNNASVDVGTGGVFQVPTLVGIAWRPPFMHNGCAPTLRDRFTAPCGGGDRHGHTSQLTPSQIDDLVAYLETL